MQKTMKLAPPPEPTEAEIQKVLIKRLFMNNWLTVRINGTGMKDSKGQYVMGYIIAGLAKSIGFPDVVAFRGHDSGRIEALLIEVKRKGGKLSDGQKRFHEFAKDRFNIDVLVIEGWDEMEEFTAQLRPLKSKVRHEN